MSVDLESWMVADGLDPLHYVKDPSTGARRIRVGALRALGLQVGWAPVAGNSHHGLVWGLDKTSRRKKVLGLAELIRKAAGET